MNRQPAQRRRAWWPAAQLGLALGVAVIGVLVATTLQPSAASGLAAQTPVEQLRSWSDQVSAQGGASKVSDARVEGLALVLRRIGPKARNELTQLGRTQGGNVLMLLMRQRVGPALERLAPRLSRSQSFFFFTDVQYWLEQLSLPVGKRGRLMFRPDLGWTQVPSLDRYHEQIVTDSDGDGIPDAVDPDDDGDGVPDAKDSSDNVSGIPDAWMAREDVDGDQEEDGAADAVDKSPNAAGRPCFFVDEELLDFHTVAAARSFYAKRGCAPSLAAKARKAKAKKSAKPKHSAKKAATKKKPHAKHRARGRVLTGPPVIPSNTAPPTISGTPAVGETLTASPGTWTGTPAPTFAFVWQWEDSPGHWSPIAGATAGTYTVESSDGGHNIRVEVTGSNKLGSNRADSAIVTIQAAGTIPKNTSAPSISGTPQAGQVLKASPGAWSGSPAPTFAYAWQSSSNGNTWKAIAGAKASTYTPVLGDVGSKLRVVVTATNSAGHNDAASAAIGPVVANGSPKNTAVPTISGTVQVGSALTASPGSWTGSPSFTYAWERSTDNASTWTTIANATGTTYTPTQDDLKADLRVKVTATNSSGSSFAYSAQVGPVTQGGCSDPTLDTDKDKVPDCQELAGGQIQIQNGTGAEQPRSFKSDPTKTDTDNDGIGDYDEWSKKVSDPSATDSDSDDLTDYEEFKQYGSVPNDMDTDNDALEPGKSTATVDPRFEDGTEVKGYAGDNTTIATSPTLSDTDGDCVPSSGSICKNGDGYSDWDEVNKGGTNPLVADVPVASVFVTPNTTSDIAVNATLTDTQTTTDYNGSLNTATTKNVDLTTKTQVTEIGGNVKAGWQTKKGFNASAEFDASHSWTTEHQTGYTNTLQNKYQQYTEDSSEHGVKLNGGSLGATVSVQNLGTRSFIPKTLEVTAFQPDPDQPGKLKPIATLVPGNGVNQTTFTPGETNGPYKVTDSSVSTLQLLQLEADPGALVYAIPDPELDDPTTGKSYGATIGSNLPVQTAEISIDYGPGHTDPTDKLAPKDYFVATNVDRTPEGLTAGITMSKVLQILNIDHKTSGCASGQPAGILCEVNGVESQPSGPNQPFHAWAVTASTDVDVTTPASFDDIVVKPRSVVHLIYMVDSDGDGLFDTTEDDYGTDPTKVDTDGDGISDYDETQNGWKVPYPQDSPYQIYSNPLSKDIDNDGSWDGCPGAAATCGQSQYRPESKRSTDPDDPDTNSDGRLDGSQADDAVLAVCPNCFRVPSQTTPITVGAPDGVAVDQRSGTIWAAGDVSNAVEGFDVTGKSTATLTLGVGADGVAVDPETSNVWVTSSSAGKLFEFDPHGSQLKSIDISSFPNASSPSAPWGVATDAAGNVYVAAQTQQGHAVILEYDSDGAATASHVDPALPGAHGIAVDNQGHVYISVIFPPPSSKKDPLPPPPAIAVYDSKDSFNRLAEWNASQASPGFRLPYFLAVDPGRTLYVSDAGNGTVQKYLANGTYLASWSGGSLLEPTGLAFDSACNLYVGDGDESVGLHRYAYPNGCATP